MERIRVGARLVCYVLLSGMVFLGCQLKTAPPAAHLDKQTISPKALFEHLLAAQKPVDNLKAFIRTTVSRLDSRHTFKQVLLIDNNEAMRLDTMGPFGRTLSVFILTPNQTLLYDPAKNQVYRDQEVWNVMDKLIGTTLNLRELITAFSGNIPHLEEHRVTGAVLNPERTHYQLDTRGPHGLNRFIIDLDSYTLLPARWIKFYEGRKIYTVEWSEYKALENRQFPHKIEITRQALREHLTIKFKNLKINQGLPPDAFELPRPTPEPEGFL